MNKAAGFITIHRQILDWEWYGDINTFRLFVHLLLIANFTDGKFGGRTVKRGQVVTSLANLATQTSLSVHQVRVSLNHLLMTGEVTSEANSRYRVITIVKYDEYQKLDKPIDKQVADKVTSEWQAGDKQVAISVTGEWQQYNHDNHNNHETMEQGNQSIPLVDSDLLFNAFWDFYPKKRARKAAEKAWKKLNPDNLLYHTIVNALEKWKQTDEWKKADGQYIPYASTWLNGRRWEDEIPVRKVIESVSPVKTVVAQRYDQRDYSGEQEDARDRMIRQYRQEVGS